MEPGDILVCAFQDEITVGYDDAGVTIAESLTDNGASLNIGWAHVSKLISALEKAWKLHREQT